MKHRYKYGVKAAVSTAALLSVSIGAFGQDTQPEEIIVTGSYIRGSAEDAASPVDVISRDDFLVQGAVLPSDIIANIGINSGSTTNLDANAENNNIAGAGNVNLRNLGLNSTLVLINGKRQTVAAARTQRGETFVDINEIPAIMLQRVEVLKNGASATYGSDAIAGVVNFITRENFVGMDFSAQYLRTSESNQDDLVIGGVYGWASEDDRTRLVIGADYLMRSDLPTLDKDLQARQDNSAILGGTITRTLGTGFNPAFQNFGGGNFTDPNCGPAGGFTGVPFAPQNAECRTDTRKYQIYIPETNRVNALLNLSHKFNDRAKVYSEVLFSKTDLKIPTATAISPLGGQLYLPNTGPIALGSIDPALAFTNNPNPFRAGSNPLNSPNSLANGGFGALSTIDTVIGDYGPRMEKNNDSDSQRYVVGLKGDLPFAGKEVSYDVSVGYSRNERVTRMDGVDRDKFELALFGLGGPNCTPNGVENLPLLENPALAGAFRNLAFFFTAPIDPEFATTNRKNLSLALSSTNQGQGGCQFLNPFLSAQLNPALANDPALLQSLRLPNVKVNDSMTELRVFDAVFTADLWELDAGPVAAALGFQYREDSRTSEQQPERFSTNLITSVAFTPNNPATNGQTTLRPISNDALYGTLTNKFDASIDVKAAFLEVQVPVTRSLEVGFATRYERVGLDVGFKPVSLSFAGALDNVDSTLGDELTSKISFRWQALDSVAFRGSFGQSFRVPNLGLLFEGSGYDGAAVIDPLASDAVRSGARDPSEVFTDPALLAASRRAPLRLGLPSPELQPEKADSYDLGIIFTPIAGLNVSLDYYRVDFRDAIVPKPFADVLQSQVDLFNQIKNDPNTLYVSTVNGQPCTRGVALPQGQGVCVVQPDQYFVPGVNGGFAPVERVNGAIAVVRVNDINAGSILTDGLELGANYTVNGLGGRWIFATDWTYVNKYETEIGGIKFDGEGRTNDEQPPQRSLPDLRGSLTATYARGNYSITALARHIGSYEDDFNANTIESYTTFDLSAGLSMKWSSQFDPLNLRLGIIDVTDEDIPRRPGLGRGFDTTVFSPNGRRFFLQLQQSF